MLFILLVAAAGLLYFWLTKTYSFWENLKVPGPKPKLFFGNIKENVLGKKFISFPVADIYKQFPNEKYVGLYFIRTPVLLVRDLDLIKNILIKDFDSFSFRGVNFSEEGLGANLFHADGDTWNVLRKRLSPMFTSGKLKNMFYLVNECATSLSDFIQEEINGNKNITAHTLTARYTTAVICACAFGLDAKTMSDEYNIFLDFGNKIFTPSWKVFLESVFPGTLRRFNISFFPKDVIDFFYNLVRNVVKEREGKPKTRNDFMDMLVEMKEQGQVVGNKVKSEEIVDLQVTEGVMAAQALLFFAAGFETSATTMAFMLYELARNRDVQERLIQEVDRVLEKYDGKVTYESLNDFNYLGMVMSETLRMYPIVDPLQREATMDYTFPGTDLTIPKGTFIVIPELALQMDPKYWPNPGKFDPERFSNENDKSWHQMTFQAFGQGPRACLGARFARVQIIVGMAEILRHFRVEPNKRTPEHLDYNANRLVLQPLGGIPISIKQRIL